MASQAPKRRRLRAVSSASLNQATASEEGALTVATPSRERQDGESSQTGRQVINTSQSSTDLDVIVLDDSEEPTSSSSRQAPAPAELRGSSALAAAQPPLLATLRQQVASAHELRVSIEDELAAAFSAWLEKEPAQSAEDAVRQMLEPLVGETGSGSPASVLAAAAEEAAGVGLPLPSELSQRLAALCQEEDKEGVWRCLCTALSDADRLSVAFWSNEAQQMGFELPKELTLAMAALRQEEASRLQRMEGDASFAARAAEAHARGDVTLLQSLVAEAEQSGKDPSAAIAALADLTGEEVPVEEEGLQEEELERLFVSSPKGQNHCFGMYVLVPEERGNGFPVWRQLGGERWIYSDEMGRWCVGSNSVREGQFKGSAGFLFCPHKHHGAQPDKMQVWCRFDEETKKWKKDEEISIASEYVDEVAESRASKRAKGKAAAKSKGRGGRGRGRGGRPAKAEPKPAPKPRPAAPPLRGEARAPPPLLRPSNGMTRVKALSILGFGQQQAVTAQALRKAYRGQALRWHPDRHADPAAKQEANKKFVELRNALELLEADLTPLRLMQAFESAGF